MNVLQIVPELNAGGVERTALEVSEALIAAGHGAHVASQGGRMVPELLALGGVFHDLPLASKNPFKIGANTARILECIQLHDIHIVHARSRAPAFAACRAAEVANIPFVTTYHGIYNARSRLKRRYNAVMTKGDLIIANSQYTAKHIVSEHGTDPSRIRVVPRGVDMTRFAKEVPTERRAAVRARWGVADTDTVIFLPGRLTRWKGQLTAIAAMQNVPNAVLVIQGDAQGRDAYVAELRAAIGTARVILADHDSDMPAAFAACDIALSCSTDPEAFGRVSAEAGAMGRVVIASAHGGSLEIIADGETGFLVPPADAAALTAQIAACLSMPPAARTAMGRAAQIRVRERFTTQGMCAAVLAVYAEVLGDKAR